MRSDPLDQRFNVNYEKINSYYYESFDEYSHCNVETGCNLNMTSASE